MTLDVIAYAYKYNGWATDLLLESMEQLTPEQYAAPGCSGHGSIRDTFAHFMSSQHAWVSWYEGKITVSNAIKLRLRPDDVATVVQARQRWLPILAQTNAFVAGLTDDRIHQYLEWGIPNGPSGKSRMWQMLLHTANHGTHTRAQVVAAIRRAGYTPGNIEMLMYVMTHPDD